MRFKVCGWLWLWMMVGAAAVMPVLVQSASADPHGQVLSGTSPLSNRSTQDQSQQHAPLCHDIKTCRGPGEGDCQIESTCDDESDFTEKVSGVLTAIAPAEDSVLQQRLEAEQSIASSPFVLTFDQPNYVMPFYYTASPYKSIYQGQTPDNQAVQSEEFKAQFSFKYPIWRAMAGTGFDLGMSYTQVFYWQVYAKSQYFRETNYMPAVTISNNFHKNWMGTLGLVHQSNGRGGDLERSWNRVYLDLLLSGDQWSFSFKPWLLVFKAQSSDLHNSDITRYLGYGRMLVATQFSHGQQLALNVRNALESGFKRGAYELTYSIPIYGHSVRGYINIFSGYGQSLLEYNHKTNAVGVGFAFNDWIIAPYKHHPKKPASGVPLGQAQ